MINKVYISGDLGRVIYKENENYFCMDMEQLDTPIPCSSRDLNLFFSSGAELTTIEGKSIAIDSIKKSVELETNIHQALTLVISGFNPDLTEGTRKLSIDAADDLLQFSEVEDFVRNRLLSRHLPANADLEKAILYSNELNCKKLNLIYEELNSSRAIIAELLMEWQQVSIDFFSSKEEIMECENLLIEFGVFSQIVKAINQKDPKLLGTVVFDFGLNLTFKNRIPQGIKIINRLKSLLAQKYSHILKKVTQTDSKEELEPIDPIVELIVNFKKKVRKKRKGAIEAKEKIDTQINSIAELIKQNNFSRAKNYLFDLIQYNLVHGKKKHVGMTLCNLAKTALDSNAFDIAKKLIDYAMLLNIDDPIIFRQHAEVLKEMGQLPEALDAYEVTIQKFPNNAITQTGRAEILKEMGKLPEALDAYEVTMQRFPNNVVTQTGRAGVLKEMGKLPEALDAYEATIQKFQNDVFTQNGRAEVLKEMGKLPEALEAYEVTMQKFPNDVVTQSGRAEVLKEMGKLPEALEAYENTIQKFPNDVVAKTGRACILILLDRIEDARLFLQIDKPLSKSDWIRYHIFAMTYLKSGDFEEAIECLSFGLQNSPWVKDKHYFGTALAFARMKKRDYAAAIEVLEKDIEIVDTNHKQKRLVLISHAQAELAQKTEASDTLSSIGDVRNLRIISLKTLIRKCYCLSNGIKFEQLESDKVLELKNKIEEEEFYLLVA